MEHFVYAQTENGLSKDEITAEDWNVWLRKLCKIIHRRLEKIVGYKRSIKYFLYFIKSIFIL